MKKVTLQVIADELQLSKSLVSKALSNQNGVSEETREKVRLTAIKLGYPTNSSGVFVHSSKTGNIAVLIPRVDLDDLEYWGKIIKSIESELSKKSFSLILSGVDPAVSTREGIPGCITVRKVDGAFVLGLMPTAYILAVLSTGVPVVLIDSFNMELKLDHVLAENFLGGYDAARYVLERGHCRIGFVGDVEYSISFEERFRGFTTAIREYRKENSVAEIEEFQITDSRGDSRIPFSIDQCREVLRGNGRPTALICANDPIAFDVLQLLEDMKIRCPEEISVIGFDNTGKCDWVSPALTSVDVCKEAIGARAVEMLLRRMTDPQLRPEHILITTQIVSRASVAPQSAE